MGRLKGPVHCASTLHAVQLLRLVAEAVSPHGRQVLFYLAAAVSDFFVPWQQLVRPSMHHFPWSAWRVALDTSSMSRAAHQLRSKLSKECANGVCIA